MNTYRDITILKSYRSMGFKALLGCWLVIMVMAGCAPEQISDIVGQGAVLTDQESLVFVDRIFEFYPELAGKSYEKARITRVVDGDTYVTDSNQRVRIIGVDTPEVFGQVEYYGQEASDFSKQRLEGRIVYMFKDVRDTDRYDRLLRYIFIEGELQMFNETLLLKGYANTMTIAPDVTFAERFVQLEREARERNAGLWGR